MTADPKPGAKGPDRPVFEPHAYQIVFASPRGERTVSIHGSLGAPCPNAGDTYLLDAADGGDGDYEVLAVQREAGGWWASCGRATGD